MANLTPPPQSLTEDSNLPTPWRCFSGAAVSAAIAFALYLLTASISHTFAGKPIHSDNTTAINISIAVRTLVVGMSALGTGIFGLASFGLFGLGIQLLVQRFTNKPANS